MLYQLMKLLNGDNAVYIVERVDNVLTNWGTEEVALIGGIFKDSKKAEKLKAGLIEAGVAEENLRIRVVPSDF